MLPIVGSGMVQAVESSWSLQLMAERDSRTKFRGNNFLAQRESQGV